MRTVAALTVAALALGTGRLARFEAAAMRREADLGAPYAPSPRATPFASLGYREAAADLLFIRLRGYFGGGSESADATSSLVEAIASLDPRFYRIYEYGAHAMLLSRDAGQTTYHRVIELLERGMEQYPQDYKLPLLAAQIYTQDLVTKDPMQRREWDEAGTKLAEAAVRKPSAPAGLADWVAVMQTKLGQRERAIEGLKEVLLVTEDQHARQALIERLAKLEENDADEIAAEIYEMRRRFEESWHAERPAITATFFILVGPPLEQAFDMGTLAMGGISLPDKPIERLEPLND